MSYTPSTDLIERAMDLAAKWQRQANARLTFREKIIQKKLLRLIRSPMGKVVMTRMIDQSFRSADTGRMADQVHHLLGRYGIPDFFTGPEKLLLRLFQTIGRRIPLLSVPMMMAQIRYNAGRMVIAGETRRLSRHLALQNRHGIRVNLNHLGEMVLGETEAQRRMRAYLTALEDPQIGYLSVKISTIFSQIQNLAFDTCTDLLAQRLQTLYRKANQCTYLEPKGNRTAKTINLDMEAYDDLHLTIAAFQKALAAPDLKNYSAGIVLQAYIPESFELQQQLTHWAKARVNAGGSPIKLRIVKGANMEMEWITATLHGWPLASFDNKVDVDANYKRMLLFGVQPENIAAVRLGIASHNLFELALALLAARDAGTDQKIVFELLEGMANHVRRVLRQEGLPVLAYTPVAEKKEFINAIAYLIRRLDENTGPDNFLGHAALADPTSLQWLKLQHGFLTAVRQMHQQSQLSHRSQNRMAEAPHARPFTSTNDAFTNEPNTDWTIAPNRQWADAIRQKWKKTENDVPITIPLVIGGRSVIRPSSTMDIIDANQQPRQIRVARCSLAKENDIATAIAIGHRDPEQWHTRSIEQRHVILKRVAAEIQKARGDLIGAAAAGAGKLFSETDAEVSEAIDLVRYYPQSLTAVRRQTNLRIEGKGLAVVTSPWNFPVAIACGGMAAALTAGNTVIFKPSSEALLPAWELCKCFWAAGVSQNTLQFLPCRGSQMGHNLIGHPHVDIVILTGGTATAFEMLKQRPDLFIAAETGGKNATIVTATADREQAIKNVVYSAFGHSGQKCSATSLLILEKEVYHDDHFKNVLVDATRSLSAGSAWDFFNRIGPLIHPPANALLRGLTQLEPGESWALKPRQIRENPYLWAPGIKYGVRPGSFTHTTELFGPVLGVMCADNLEHAVDLANATGYGLTAGIESLDDREIAFWKKTMMAGNLYINRSTTGALTLRQPFGGMKKSAVGPGIKAGGPNYVTQFIRVTESRPPQPEVIQTEHWLLSMAQRWEQKADQHPKDEPIIHYIKSARAIRSYLAWAHKEFNQSIDRFHLRGEDNHHRYLPVGRMGIFIHPEDTLFETIARIAAGIICRCRMTLIVTGQVDNAVQNFLNSADGKNLLSHCEVHGWDGKATGEMVMAVDRLRFSTPERVPMTIYKAAARHGRYIARAPVLMEGRLELLHYLLNQNITHAYHRYGNIGERVLTRGN